jgi:hypothetical protein
MLMMQMQHCAYMVAIDEAYFTIDSTFKALFSEREFLILLLNEEASTLFLAFFFVADYCCCSLTTC